ncbi:hypothetical protein DY000_02060138 [Brassica cretica]|uniref:Uncharacterized protein n=1 Tax=Brassica cretica TaxID=69181 RepID=A0ABQ7APB9_BRACR|nr:hypothetical protein DY000_02060138 [Brassica cretica]
MLWLELRSMLLQTSVIAQINNVQLALDQLSFRVRTRSEHRSMLWLELRSMLLQTSVIAQINNVQLALDQLSYAPR